MTTENIITGTWLPVFPGFYGTYFDGDNMYEQEIDFINEHVLPKDLAEAMVENLYNSDAGTKLWNDYTESTARQCVKIIEQELKKLNFVDSIVFEEISSPKAYNFINDSINVQVIFTSENLQNIRHYIYEHFAQWREYLKGTYTSRDGFISYHSNQPGDEEWFVDNALRGSHNAGAVLEFLCGEHEITSETLVNNCESVEGIDLYALEKQCYEEGWYVPDTLWNRLKDYRFPVRFKVIGSWAARQYVLDTKKQRYIFAVTKAEPKTDIFLHKRFFKIFLFGWLKNEKGDKA